MPINRSQICEAQFFKKNTWYHHIFDTVFNPACRFGQTISNSRNFFKHPLDIIFCFQIMTIRTNFAQIFMHGPNVWSNGHFIIIQNNHQFSLLMTDMIESLKSHTTSKRSITNHRDNLVVLTLQITCKGHPHRSRQ
ncbi:hypothetical protein D3C74_381870 [compost metagenome]